ncbi:hypothetical protein [uncultured Friedmanniella sp.]|uniref:hypothetical protein n=1 Tax=uncultured Friedmanniella sp. TaxID=335381 RepID=UPI0035CC2059
MSATDIERWNRIAGSVVIAHMLSMDVPVLDTLLVGISRLLPATLPSTRPTWFRHRSRGL